MPDRVLRLVQWCQRLEPRQCGDFVLVKNDRLGEIDPAMHNPVPYRRHLYRAEARFEMAQHDIQRGGMAGHLGGAQQRVGRFPAACCGLQPRCLAEPFDLAAHALFEIGPIFEQRKFDRG